MKNLFLLAVTLVLIAQNVNAQYSATPYDSKDMIAFSQSKKTYGILIGDANYDNALKAAMGSIWKLTPVDYITWEEFEKNYNQPENSFIAPCGFKYLKKKNKFEVILDDYSYLALFNGTKKEFNRFTYDDVLAYCPLDVFAGTEYDLVSAYKRMPLLIANLQNAINLVKEQKIGGSSLNMVNKFKEIYNKETKILKTKILLINSDRKGGIEESDIKKVYSNKFEYVPASKIEEAIKNKDPKYAIYVTAATKNKSMFVFDAATYKCIYAEYQISGYNVKEKDFEDLTNKIQGKK